MESQKPSLTPSIIIAVGLIASSLVLYLGMARLGDSIFAAGARASQVSLNSNSMPLKVELAGESDTSIIEVR